MDLKIPQIKIDLHDDVCEASTEVPQKPRHRASSSPDLIDHNGDLHKLRRRIKMRKSGSLDTNFTLKESREDKLSPDVKMEAPSSSSEGTTRREKKITKPKNIEIFSLEKGISKRNSFPAIAVNGRGNGSVDALVSPLLLRKFTIPKHASTHDIPQRRATGGTESVVRSGANSPRLPKIKSSWMSLDDNNETVKDKTRPIQTQGSPSFPRKDMLDVLSARKPRKDDGEGDTTDRPRSSSLTLSLEHTSHQPSMHWKIARDHVGKKKTSLPNTVQLFRNNANERQMIGNRSMVNLQSDTDKNRGRTNHLKSKNKDFYGHEDGSGETLNRNSKQSISLEKRLEAIEIRHGIMHEN